MLAMQAGVHAFSADWSLLHVAKNCECFLVKTAVPLHLHRVPADLLLHHGLTHVPQHNVSGRLRVGRDSSADRTLQSTSLVPEVAHTALTHTVGAGQEDGVLEDVTAHRAEEVLLSQRGSGGHVLTCKSSKASVGTAERNSYICASLQNTVQRGGANVSECICSGTHFSVGLYVSKNMYRPKPSLQTKLQAFFEEAPLLDVYALNQSKHQIKKK